MATKLEVKQSRNAARAANAGRRKRKRKRNRTLHYLILLIFLLGTGATLSFTVFFKVEGIEVLGAEKYTPDDIAAVTGVELEENLLRINKKEITENILEAFPYIDSVEIRRKLPPRVEITVTQAEPAGAISLGDEVVLIDETGKVLERGTLIIPEHVVVIKGVDASEAVPGEILGEYTPPPLSSGEVPSASEQQRQQKAETVAKQLVMFRYLLEAMEESGFTNLTNVDVSDLLNMRVLFENRITLELGVEAQLTDKLILCKYVLENSIGPTETGRLTPDMNRERNQAVFSPGGRGEPTVTYEQAPQTAEPEDDDEGVEDDDNENG